jgi:CubicO group peptidase (beta-lactamase class C family)
MKPKFGTLLAALACALLAGCATPPPAAADRPATTLRGNTFVVPAGWTLESGVRTTTLRAPEAGSSITFVDVEAADAAAAVAQAWATRPTPPTWPLKVVTPAAARDGWTDRATYSYQTSPNEKRTVLADVRRANGVWTVALYDMAEDVAEKRLAQVGAVFGRLLPKGYTRENFAGRRAHTLDATRLAELKAFVQRAMAATGVPGVGLGLVQGGRVVFAGGLGVRELGRPEPVDADTRFMIASNTKALATLMLAKLVEQKRVGWESPAAQLLPSFRLGDAATTAQVRVKHLICACTGMPRQDLEWLLEFGALTPEGAMALLGTMQPTSGFGELFQYSNPMAAAAGYIGGHVAYPELELGAAYDRAMQALVFDPLGMARTTHDFALAQQGNAAIAHAPDVDGRMTRAEDRTNLSIVPVRPAGGAWSTVADMLKYIQMELDEGRGYIAKDALLARRAPQVTVGADVVYGMGLQTNTLYGTPLVHHGGDMIGFHSDMMWLPEHNVGAVVLTNADPGWLVRTQFRRKLLEVLFDGRAEADAAVAAQTKAFYDELGAERRLLTLPADAKLAATLATRYHHPAVGTVAVGRAGAALRLDFGEWSSEVGSRRNPDGTDSLITTVPGFNGLEFVVGGTNGRRTLTLRDAQHEYVLTESP